MILKFLSVIVISSIFLVGCSEYEREKILNEIKVAMMSEKEKLRMKRFEILERDTEMEVKRKIIDYYDSNNKPYTNVNIRYYIPQDNDGTYWTHPSYPNKIGYKADFVADVYYENLFFSNSAEISGEITFFFDDDERSLNYKIHSPPHRWIVANGSTRPTETSNEVINFVGDLLTK